MKKLFLLVAAWVLVSCNSQSKGTYKEQSISILLDLTSYEKNPQGVKKEFEKVADEILLVLQDPEVYEQFLGGKVILNVIDDKGENLPLWEVRISKKIGMHRAQFKQSINEIALKFKESSDELEKSTHSYQKTMILESIISSLQKLKEGDSLYVISDLYVVDKKSNFEKMKFGWPVDLSSYTQNKKVHLRRIPLLGRDYEQIHVVESWWKSSLEGDSLYFQKAYTEWENNHKKELLKLAENKPEPVVKNLAFSKSPQKKIQAVDLSAKARHVIAKNVGQLKHCYDSELDKSDLPLFGTLAIEVIVFENGRVKNIKVIREKGVISEGISSCIKNVLAKLDFPRPPQGSEGLVKQSLNFNVRL